MRLFAFIILFTFLASAFFALPAGAFDVMLQKPEANATASAGDNKFEFSASGKSPLSCSLLVDSAVALSDIAAYKNLPVLVHASVSEGERTWSVECVDADGAQNESETRSLTATAAASNDSADIASPLPENAGSLAGFVIAAGAEGEETAVVASWRTNPGRAVKFAALFSNDGSNALNVSLKIAITNATGASGENGETIAALESPVLQVGPGEKRVLQLEWTPAVEGTFVANAAVATVSGGGETVFGRAYLQLSVVRPASADWLFLLAFVCVALLCLAVFKIRQNAAAIRGGSLK
ncbi:MAG: hypothetical protein V1817_00740 [Candidatus Micrarchaeota archaeon]